jgi:hypothetical protein
MVFFGMAVSKRNSPEARLSDAFTVFQKTGSTVAAEALLQVGVYAGPALRTASQKFRCLRFLPTRS